MTIKLGVVMDPIADITYKKDTTLAMLWAASDRNWELYYMEPPALYLDQGIARAGMSPLKVYRDPDAWFELGAPEERELADLDVILMRKDPPFDMEYIYTTYILDRAAAAGALARALRGAGARWPGARLGAEEQLELPASLLRGAESYARGVVSQDEGVLLVPGRTAVTAHSTCAGDQRRVHDVRLPGPGAGRGAVYSPGGEGIPGFARSSTVGCRKTAGIRVVGAARAGSQLRGLPPGEEGPGPVPDTALQAEGPAGPGMPGASVAFPASTACCCSHASPSLTASHAHSAISSGAKCPMPGGR